MGVDRQLFEAGPTQADHAVARATVRIVTVPGTVFRRPGAVPETIAPVAAVAVAP